MNRFYMCPSLINDLKKPSPTEFLGKIRDCIDLDKYGYHIIRPLPDDKNAMEVQYCLDFLIMANNGEFDNYLNRTMPKYITLWSMIYGFIGIRKNSGFDYLLMNYLDHMEYIEYGSGIRCAWLDKIPDGHEVDEGHMKKLLDWARDCDNNGEIHRASTAIASKV